MYGERLKYLRNTANLTQEQLGKLFEISARAVSNYENESRQIPIDLQLKIANYFDVTVDYILGRTNEPNYSFISKEELPKELIEVGYDYLVVVKEAKESGLTPDELQDLIQFAKNFKK